MTATPSNLVTISSADHFTSLMSADLNRVSLLNFWASWAEPCEQMNSVVLELAEKYPQVLCLMIEAEAQPDVSESFDIDSVPSFILLRGHTLLSKISGANAAALTAAIASHATGSTHNSTPSSYTSAPPQVASANYTANGSAPGAIGEHIAPVNETNEQLEKRCKKLMEKSKVVLFMKGNPEQPRCGFSQKTVALLKQEKVPFSTFDILQDEGVRQGLKQLNDWPTFPQIIVNGELIGGLDILKELVETGEFKEMLQ
ncbi:hypothetical protein CBS101457_000478 [Exobasidium rhododendri]|nr:hypothetical protein CBS101457_000478 [Exobasidium rhododendri]